MARSPFAIGDRIQIGDHAGDVVDVRVFQFTLLEILNWVNADQSTGRVIHVPNGQLFSEPLVNYSRGIGYIWNEVPVRVTYESDWQKAKTLLLDIAGRHDAQLGPEEQQKLRETPRPYVILYSVLTPTVYTRVEAYSVVLTIRYLCEPRKRRASEHAIWEDILKEFSRQANIEFAYPTTRFYQRSREGHGLPAYRDEQPGSTSQGADTRRD
jgi:small-conductance mechanosensitive channel